MNDKVTKIILEFKDRRQTLTGDAADKWFNAIVEQMKQLRVAPLEIVMAPWKKRRNNLRK